MIRNHYESYFQGSTRDSVARAFSLSASPCWCGQYILKSSFSLRNMEVSRDVYTSRDESKDFLVG